VSNLVQERVLVTGGHGFLGRSVCAGLQARGVGQVLAPTRAACDLRDPAATTRLVHESFGGAGPTVVLHLANFTGGLGANRQWPTRFFRDSLVMPLNLLDALAIHPAMGPRGLAGVRFVQVGTMCSYPADAAIPYCEDSLWRGVPERDIASYGLGKLAVLQALKAYSAEFGLAWAYVIPTGFFGPGDNLDPSRSHVCGAMVRKYVDAVKQRQAEVVNWGTGIAKRDFVYVDDAAEGVLLAAETCRALPPEPINLTGGEEVSIRELAELVSRLSGFAGRTVWDASKGDGQLRRALDGRRAAERLGFRPRVSLEEGLRRTVAWYSATLPT